MWRFIFTPACLMLWYLSKGSNLPVTKYRTLSTFRYPSFVSRRRKYATNGIIVLLRVRSFRGSVAEESSVVGLTLCGWVGRSRRFGRMSEGTGRMTLRHIVTSPKTRTFSLIIIR